MQAPGKWSGNGTFKCALTLAGGVYGGRSLALWGDRVALAYAQRSTVAVFDLVAGVVKPLHVFGCYGVSSGSFFYPVALCAHPSGSLLVLESNGRVQEFTWTGTYVRTVSHPKINSWRLNGIALSPDGSLIAVSDMDTGSIGVLDAKTCAHVARLGRIQLKFIFRPCIRFSPDGNRVAVTVPQHKPAMVYVNENGNDAEFGAADGEYVEFTDEGDVVVASGGGVTVYSGTTLERVRSWAWPASVHRVHTIQAHRGLLYVLCTVRPGFKVEMYVYE